MTPQRTVRKGARQAPRWYLSLRSPYSWLALHDCLTHYPDFAQAAQWQIFYEPDAATASRLAEERVTFPYVPMSKAKHLYILRDVARLSAERGLRPTWPIDREPRWEVPSLAVLAAREHGEQSARDLAIRLTRARWERSGAITDPAVVAECARDAGLPPELSEAAEQPRWREAGVAQLRSVEGDGVFGVPFFVVARQPFWGLDRLPAAVGEFRRHNPESDVALNGAEQSSAGDLDAVPTPAADAGHAGGCG